MNCHHQRGVLARGICFWVERASRRAWRLLTMERFRVSLWRKAKSERRKGDRRSYALAAAAADSAFGLGKVSLTSLGSSEIRPSTPQDASRSRSSRLVHCPGDELHLAAVCLFDEQVRYQRMMRDKELGSAIRSTVAWHLRDRTCSPAAATDRFRGVARERRVRMRKPQSRAAADRRAVPRSAFPLRPRSSTRCRATPMTRSAAACLRATRAHSQYGAQSIARSLADTLRPFTSDRGADSERRSRE